MYAASGERGVPKERFAAFGAFDDSAARRPEDQESDSPYQPPALPPQHHCREVCAHAGGKAGRRQTPRCPSAASALRPLPQRIFFVPRVGRGRWPPRAAMPPLLWRYLSPDAIATIIGKFAMSSRKFSNSEPQEIWPPSSSDRCGCHFELKIGAYLPRRSIQSPG